MFSKFLLYHKWLEQFCCYSYPSLSECNPSYVVQLSSIEIEQSAENFQQFTEIKYGWRFKKPTIGQKKGKGKYCLYDLQTIC